MAATPRKPPADSTAPGAEAMITTLTRVFARMVVSQAAGTMALTFRQICTQQMRIANDAEVDILEAWMTGHPDG